MKKEVLISIIIGFVLGLIITFGIYFAKKSYRFVFEKPQVTVIEEGIDFSSPDALKKALSVISPIDQSIIKEGKTVINGVTWPNSTVLIIGEKGERVVASDNKGSFESELLLDSGENNIIIHSFSENGLETSKVITVVYSTAEI